MKILQGKLEADFRSSATMPPFVWEMEADVSDDLKVQCYRQDVSGDWSPIPSDTTVLSPGKRRLVVTVDHFSRYAWGSVP